ncbi:hypothetical protein BSZ39_06940 [Bowdeniella nasicola]|uniref:M23ase beta-sheet core domain-containing protein n=1 Tax=Bowdeniella nasicola TaxID=208480 RepID=A0A1Q5Q2I0_9ACTO|nr:M23 family metallopeptidase [Bowdeniella nasicola]OKL53925.1 hypothetical protein BSZ39_06940 [Bowdeniella nasicola]
MLARRLAAAVLTAGLTLSGVVIAIDTTPAAADSKDDLIRQREERARKREQIQSELEGIDSSLSTLYLQLEETKSQLAFAQTVLAQAEEQLAGAQRKQEHIAGRLVAAEGERDRISDDIEETNAQIEGNKGALAEVVRTSYRSGGANLGSLSDLYEIGVGEDSVQALAARNAAVRSQTRVLDQLAQLNAKNRNANARQEAVTELITDLKAQADQAVADANAARDAKEAKTVEISELQTNQTALAGDLESKKEQAIANRAANDAADNELKNQIAQIVAEEKRRAEEERKKAKPRPGPGPGKPAPNPQNPKPKPGPSAGLIPPVPRPLQVTSPYGYRVYPITGGWFMHNGVDLRSACGNPQVSSAGGVVTATKPARGNGTHGNQVIINHGLIGGVSYVTVYNHLSGFAVRPGQSVSQGQVIGYTGATGKVTGCHVHFEVWKNGATINPMSLPGF